MVSLKKALITGSLLLGVGLLCSCSTLSFSLTRKAVEPPTIVEEEITPVEEEEQPTAFLEAEEDEPIPYFHDDFLLYGWNKWFFFDWSSIERPEPVVEEEIIIEEEHPTDYTIGYVCLGFMAAITVIGGINGNIRRKRWERLILEKRMTKG